MKLVETRRMAREGGKCANCDRDKHADTMFYCIVSLRFEMKGIFLEPAYLCSDCINTMEKV